MNQKVVLLIVLACGIAVGFALAQAVAVIRAKKANKAQLSEQSPVRQDDTPQYCELDFEGDSADNWIGNRLRELEDEEKFYLLPDITSESLARKIGTNRTYLSRFFNSRGITFSQYVNSMRIKYAVSRIESSEVKPKVADIARECGYRQMNSFRTAFKTYTGKLPSEYAEEHWSPEISQAKS